jgi:superfamily II DNA or RNA helicase
VALVQTLARRDLDAIKHQFGLLIVDEAHHAPSPANNYSTHYAQQEMAISMWLRRLLDRKRKTKSEAGTSFGREESTFQDREEIIE